MSSAFAQALLDTATDTDPERERQRAAREVENEVRIERLLKAYHDRVRLKRG